MQRHSLFLRRYYPYQVQRVCSQPFAKQAPLKKFAAKVIIIIFFSKYFDKKKKNLTFAKNITCKKYT